MNADDFERVYRDARGVGVFQTMLDIVKRHRTDTNMLSYEIEKIEEQCLHHELLYEMRRIAETAQDEYDAMFGPRIQLHGAPEISLEDRHLLMFAFDFESLVSEHETEQKLFLPTGFEWRESAFERAGYIYKKECGWDFPPGEAGIWLTYCLLTGGSGSPKEMWWQGNLVGFVVLYERGETESYSVAHMWTAKVARRKGVAATLLAEARRRFNVVNVAGPMTTPGEALIRTTWPEMLRRKETAVSPAPGVE